MDYTAIIIAALAVIPGVWATIQQLKKDKLDSARFALELAKQLEVKVGDLTTKFDECSKVSREKDALIANLQEQLAQKDKQIASLQAEIDDLSKRLRTIETRRKRPINQ